MDDIEVSVGGRRVRISRSDVVRAVSVGGFGSIRQHAVEVDGIAYPVKEVLARATGLDVLDFNTVQARNTLRRLGFALRSLPRGPGAESIVLSTRLHGDVEGRGAGGSTLSARASERAGTGGTVKERILALLMSSGAELDDDAIAEQLDISPRQTVNRMCRELAAAGRVERVKEPGFKIVNRVRRPGALRRRKSQTGSRDRTDDPNKDNPFLRSRGDVTPPPAVRSLEDFAQHYSWENGDVEIIGPDDPENIFNKPLKEEASRIPGAVQSELMEKAKEGPRRGYRGGSG